MTLGERIKAARVSAGMSLREMAPLVGVSAMAISKWERGASVPDAERVKVIAQATGMKPSSFIPGARPAVVLSGQHWASHREGER